MRPRSEAIWENRDENVMMKHDDLAMHSIENKEKEDKNEYKFSSLFKQFFKAVTNFMRLISNE